MRTIQLNSLQLNAVRLNGIGECQRVSHAGAPPVVPDVPDIPDIPEEPDVPSDPDVDENGYIIFEDAEVARICAENWGDGIGITSSQVAAVTSIGTVFNKNTKITKFDEFAKFVNVTELNGSDNATNAQFLGAFNGCSSLASISFPPQLASINGGAFVGTYALDITLNIPTLQSLGHNVFNRSGIRRVVNLGSISQVDDFGTTNWGGEGMFYRCENLELAIIPATVTSIAACAFYSCTSLTTFVCKASVPPTLGNTNALAETPIASGTGFIYVPDTSVEAYKTATNWSRYASSIFPVSQLAIDNPKLYAEIEEYL